MFGGRRARSWVALSLGFVLVATGFNWTPGVSAIGPNPIRYTYDANGRLSSVIDPVNGSGQYAHDAAGNVTSITRRAAATVVILEFYPDGGPIGTTVAIDGTGFSATPAQSTVRFNGTIATVVSSTTTEIVVTVPAGATTGTISVTAPGGSATSATSFTVSAMAAPTITALSATTLAVGATLTITGTGFDTTKELNNVRINDTFATLSAATATTLTVTVPAAASSGKVTVATVNGLATSAADLIVPPATYTPTDIGYSGRITVGGSGTITITQSGKKGVLVFDGLAGQRVSFMMTSGTMGGYLAVLDPFGQASLFKTWLPQPSFGYGLTYVQQGSFVDTVTLPETGTYSLFFDPLSGATGSLAITSYDVPADATASITAGGAPVTIANTVPGQNMALTFSGTASQRVSLNLTAGTVVHDFLIKKPDGSTLWGPGGVNGAFFVDTLTLPVGGTYTISIDPRDFGVGGQTFQLYDVPADATASITAGGAPVTIANTVPGQNMALTFSGTASQRVSLNLTAGTVVHDFLIKKPDGSTLWGPGGVNGAFFVDTLTLPVGGTYTISIDPRDFGVGGQTFQLYDVPADATASITAGGAPVTIANTVPGQNMALTFSGTASQRVSLNLTAGTVVHDFLIKKPDGSTLWGPGGVNGAFFVDTLTLPVGGTYTISIDPRDFGVGGQTFQLYDVPADATASTTIGGAPVTIANTVPGQNMALTFSGTASQRVSLNLTAGTVVHDFLIKKPDGSTLWGPGGVNGAFFVDTLTLPVGGTYTISIDPRDFGVGGQTFQLYDVPADATASTTIGGAPATVATTVPGQNASVTFSANLGQQFTLTFSSVTLTNLTTVKNPDGSTLNGPFGAGSGTVVGPLTAVATGTHTIFVDGTGTATGSLTVQIQAGGGGFAPTDGPDTILASVGRWRDHGVHVSPAGYVLASAVRETPGLDPQNPPDAGPSVDPDWIPDASHRTGDWRSRRGPTTWEDQEPLLAGPGITALSGIVLDLRGRPIADVGLAIDGTRARTDDTGRFLLADLEPGHHELAIDGTAGAATGPSYGFFEAHITLTPGITNVLSYTIWLPRLDTRNTVTIDSPASREYIITTPHIPGLELHIPRGAVVTGEDGEPVTEIGITPLPIDRTPFPLPVHVGVPVYFTIQPGGAYVDAGGAWLVYPNYYGNPPRDRVQFWSYDPDDLGWHVYGFGTVGADGAQVFPDRDTRLYAFTGAMFNCCGLAGPATGPEDGSDADDGDPVDLGTGLFVLSKTDVILPGPLPVNLTRTYRPNDTASRPFGIGASHNYLMFLTSANPYQEADLNLPDGGKVHFVRTSAGTAYWDAVFESTANPGRWFKSQLFWNGFGWDLRTRDGTTYVFEGEIAPLTAIRDRFGNSITINYDQGGGSLNITQVTNSSGRWIKFAYDASNRITSATDNLGKVVGYTYDASGRLWKVTDQAAGVTEYGYDASHRMTTLKDARLITFLTNEYWPDGRVKKQTQADATTYQFAYTVDGNGKVTQADVTDPLGYVRRVGFNGAGFPTSETLALGTPQAQTATYVRQSGTNLVTSMTDALARQTTFAYDTAGNVTSVTRLAGTADAVTTTTTYEPTFSQVTSVTDPLDHATTFAYDGRGNLVTITDPLDKDTTFTHNATGQPLTSTDATNQTTTYAYQFGDLVSISDPLANLTRRFTDGGGRLRFAIDPIGNRSRTDYNLLNRPTVITNPMAGLSQFTYDTNGNVLTVKDPKNNTTTYTYNTMDRVLTRKDALLKTESYTYDNNGNLLTHTDRKGQLTEYGYDPLNRQTFVGFKKVGSTYESTIAYTYDAGNRLITAVDSGAGTTTLGHDLLDRLTSDQSAAGTVGYEYDDADRRTKLTLAGQPDVTYGYDNADRLTSITQSSAVVGFTFDDAGRLITQTLPNGVVGTHTYDDASRLTSLVYTKGAATVGDLLYTYDRASQRVTAGGSLTNVTLPTAVATTTYNANNQLRKWHNNAIQPTYDLNGNMLTDGTYTYVWNARDELITVKQGTPVVATYAYDGLGRRTAKTISGTSTGLVYGGGNFIQETSGGSPSANLLTGGTDQTFVRTDGGGARYPITDALGSIIGLTDAAGSIATTYTYEPYGKTTRTGAASTNSQQYTGRENDGLALYYYRARYYNPTFGRFISEDPIGFGGSDYNLYRYVAGSPTNATDPSGRYVDSPVDVAFIAYDLYALATGSRKDFGANLAALALDGVGLLIPFATGLGAAGRLARLAKPIAAGTHAVYQSFDRLGNVEYVGITIDLVRRGAEHLRNGRIIYPIRALTNLSKADARAVEQALIQLHKLSKDGGSLANKINSIARSNPDFAELLERGYDLLRQAGYPVP